MHVFDRSCNLISTDGNLISLVASDIGDGPFNLVLPHVSFCRHVVAKEEIVRHNGLLNVGELAIDTTRARLWNPRPDWDQLWQERERIRLQVPAVFEVLRSSVPPGSLAEVVVNRSNSRSPGERGVFRPARASIDKLLEGLQTPDMAQCEEATSELAGCGVGLTPEGDDFLLGCLLAVRILLDQDTAEGLAGSIVEKAVERTTILSAEWLQSAARGECGQPWHSLLESLLQGRSGLIEAAASRILQQGHTSGSASLAGFAAVLKPAS